MSATPATIPPKRSELLNELYDRLRLMVNFVRPCAKLIEKTRHGARVRRRYDRPQTPYQRVLACADLSEATKQRLREQFAAIDPIALNDQIVHLQRPTAALGGGARHPAGAGQLMLLGRQCGYRRGRAWVIMSQACNKRCATRCITARGRLSGYPARSGERDRCGALRARGQCNGRALRTVSDRLLAVACSMLRDRTPYDRQHRLAARRPPDQRPPGATTAAEWSVAAMRGAPGFPARGRGSSMSAVAPPISTFGPSTAVRHHRLAVSRPLGVRVGLTAAP